MVLGYDKVDYFGASYGGADATAYAAPYGDHVRSVILDAPLSTPGMNELLRLHFRTHADPRMIRLDCLRSLLRLADQRDPISAGDYYANGCMDAIEPWDRSQPVSERMKQYDDDVEDLPSDYYAPFSKKS